MKMSEGVDKIEGGFLRVVRRDYYDGCYYSGDCYSSWNTWGRWVALTVIIGFFFIVIACCAMVTSRRRRRLGVQPFYGTAWMAPPKYTPNDVHQFQTYPPQHYPPQPPGPYSQYYTPTTPAPPYYPNQQNPGTGAPGGVTGGNYYAAGTEDTPQGQQGQHFSPPPVPLRSPEPVAHTPVVGHQTGETVLTHSTGSNNPYNGPPSGMPQAHVGGKM